MSRRLRCSALLVVSFALAGLAQGVAPMAVAAANVPGTTCSVFPSDNIWNTDISTAPVNSHSAAWLASTGATSGRKLHPDFGGPPYGIPYNVVTNAHATTNFDFLYWDESDPVVATQQPQGPYPYGNDLGIEQGSDAHLLAVNKDTCTLYEVGGTDYGGASTAWAGAIFNLASNSLRPATWTSADAAGLPIFPGLVRVDEVAAGSINHSIRFTVQQSDRSYLWPARHQAGSATNANLPPMGARFRLKASYNISGFNAQAQVVLTAFKKYGVIVADNGSNWYFQGTEDPAWDNEPYATMISQLKTVPASAFEAIDESKLMISANSGQAAQPCTSARLSADSTSPQQRGASITFTASSSGCTNPLYEFWTLAPGGTWTVRRSFGTAATWTWNTAGNAAGTYQVRVWANQQGTWTTASQGRAAMVFTISASPTCTTATIAPSAVTQPAGSSVVFTGGSSRCPYPRYAYYVLLNGKWTLKRSFSSTSGWTWSTAGMAPGTYYVRVWANQAGDQTATPETLAQSKVTLTGCTSAAVSPASGSSAPGTPVPFTASSSGCPNPVYEFWLKDTKGVWHLERSWGSANWTWNTTGWAKGNYSLSVWANQQGSYMGKQQVYGVANYTLA